jgi:hypothetical protein
MARNNATDFQRDVAARSGKNTYVATPSGDGTHKITRNGVTLHPRIFYAGSGGAITDANPQGDKVIVIDPNGTIGIADAAVFLQSLT